MIRRILYTLLLPLPLLGQSTVHGLVTEQNSGNRPIPGVQIKALGSAPEASDNAGAFRLVFAGKKPGDRVVVTEVVKKGYELVNRDVLANWVIPSDPRARTKIVMCVEGALARNILKYYDISQAALTRGYNDQLRRLQSQRDSARIDARAYGEQAKVLAERYTNQQNHLEELAERFARENFDDCSLIHRQAFEAFSRGDVDAAIRILESMDSEAEIARAKAQREKGRRLEAESRDMQAESDSVIRRNIDKLIFQGDVYVASGRFDDAEKSFDAAAAADSTYFDGLVKCTVYYHKKRSYDKSLRWAGAARAAAATERERIVATMLIALADRGLYRFAQAAKGYREAVAHTRKMAADDPSLLAEVAHDLVTLAVIERDLEEYDSALAHVEEAVEIYRARAQEDRTVRDRDVADAYKARGMINEKLRRFQEAEQDIRTALGILRSSRDSNDTSNDARLLELLNNLATQQYGRGDYGGAKENFTASLAIAQRLAAANPDAYAELHGIVLNNLAHVYRDQARYDSAEVSQRLAIAVLEERAVKNPLRYDQFVAITHSNLAFLQYYQRDYSGAQRTMTDCVGAYRTLAAQNPGAFTTHLCTQLNWLGLFYARDGKRDSADLLFTECLATIRAAMATDSAKYIAVLPHFLLHIGWELHSTQLARAILYTSEAIGIFQQLQREKAELASELTWCHRRLARYMLLMRQFDNAETYARIAVAMDVANPRDRAVLAACLLYNGKFEEARALYEELKDETTSMQEAAFDPRVERALRDMFLQDFDEFEKAGVTHPDVEKIRELLNDE